MLINDKKRTAVLKKSDTVTTSGFILIADTPKHQSLIFSFFGSYPDCWKMIKKKGFVFAQKLWFQENAEQKQLMYKLMQMGAQRA